MPVKSPALTLGSDPSFQTIIRSDQYNNLAPDKRKSLLQALVEMTQLERQQIAAGLQVPAPAPHAKATDDLNTLMGEADLPFTPSLPENRTDYAKGLTAIGVGTAVGMAIPGVAGAMGAGKGLMTLAEMGGGVLSRKVPQTLGLENGDPLSWDRYDTLNAALPLGIRSVAAGAKAMTRPGRTALKTADTVNQNQADDFAAQTIEHKADRQAWVNRSRGLAADQQNTYQSKADTYTQGALAKRQDIASDHQQKLTDYQDNLLAWRQRNASAAQEARSAYEVKRDAINAKVDISNQQKLTEHQTAVTEYRDRLAQHETSAQQLPKATPGMGSLKPSEYYYSQVNKMDPEVPIPASREKATWVLDQIEKHLPDFRDSRLAQLARNIRDYGAPKAQGGPEVPTGLVGPDGLPVPQSPGLPLAPNTEPGFVEFRTMLSDVGKLKGTAEGKNSGMRGLIKQLYGSIRTDLDNAPTQAGPARDLLLGGNASFRREQALEEFQDLLTFNLPSRTTDNAVIVKGEAIRKGYQKLRMEPLFTGAFDPVELEALDASVKSLTTLPKPGNPPSNPRMGQPRVLDPPSVSTLERPPTEPLAVNFPPFDPPSPPISNRLASGAPGDLPQPLPDVDPQVMNPNPWTRRVGASAGYVAGHLAGPSVGMETWQSGIIGGVVGSAVVTTPWLISKLMLSGPRGQTILRNIMAGKQTIGPKELAALTTAGRKLGIIPQGEEE